ncbi:caspase family protein [Oceanibacterium hippocampi]|uniref:caspase family protein n=1 Tax=Oceanibacterium hippocampi TaxID=745714 RepID=UPI001C382257|nr:caspase family protein [Oceanibacterium hippocampi]
MGLLFLFGIVAIFVRVDDAAAEKRLALVIGNGGYQSIGALANPSADAMLVASRLKALQFETTLLLDSNQMDMKRAIVDFGRELRRAGRDAIGLFYYAGHGIQSQGRNYLIPIEAAPTDQADLDLMGVEANWVLRQMETAGNQTNIVILDACRNNPLEATDRSVQRGLARIDAPTGSFIAYATAPGQTAVDGDGANSPFTLALANAMQTPGLPIEQMFKQVRIDVLRATNGRQTPWDSSSLVEDFYFTAMPAAVAIAPPPAAVAEPADANPVEQSLWQSVSQSADPGRLALFLQIFPNSRHAAEAQALMSKALADNMAAVITSGEANAKTPEKAQVVASAGNGNFEDRSADTTVPEKVEAEAPAKPAEPLSEHESIAFAQRSGALEDYQAYLAAYPNGVFADLARAEIAYLAKGTAVASVPATEPETPKTPSILTFDQPLLAGSAAIVGHSLRELAHSSPEYPPVKGLSPKYWKEQSCSNCHNWSPENLCTQGKFYQEKDPETLGRIPHPFGGDFKRALLAWANDGCVVDGGTEKAQAKE